jgi:hypothetical protein
MIAGIVSASTIFRHPGKNLDAESYLGGVKAAEEELAAAERRLKAAQSRVDNARLRLVEQRRIRDEQVGVIMLEERE